MEQKLELNKIHQGNCLELMKKIPDNSVDLIVTDPPYGTIKGLGGDIEKYKRLSTSDWDKTLNTAEMFRECSRVLRKSGRLILFSQEPYTSHLITKVSDNMDFNYRLVWLKDHFANCLVANKAPVSYFEDILVFTKRNPKHDFDAKHPLREYAFNIKNLINYNRTRLRKELGHYGAQHFLECNKENTQFHLCTKETYLKLKEIYDIDKEDWYIEYDILKEKNEEFMKTLNFHEPTFNLQDCEKFKSNVLEYKKDYGGLHPTQKPLDLVIDLIKTYSNERNLVLDFTIGSGTTAVACINTNRDFIGIELDEKYCEIARKRIKDGLL